MTDACIVCLEDLEVQLEVGVQDPVPAQIIPHDDLEGGKEVTEELQEPPNHQQHNNPGKVNHEEFVAQIKPCNHVLHDHCLREWSQKANSCPICRATFNVVFVLDRVGGKLVHSIFGLSYIVREDDNLGFF